MVIILYEEENDMLNFEYSNQTKIIFGKGEEDSVGKHIKAFGSKILLHYGSGSVKKFGLYNKIVKSLVEHSVEFVELGGVVANPALSLVRQGIELCQKEKVDCILAVGGGSVIDSAKAIAAGYYYEGDLWDLFVNGQKPTKALPVGVVLTLAAAGSESSISSVVTNYELSKKCGFKHEIIRPKFAILNPELTYTLPDYQTSSGAVDIIGHVIERYFTNTKNVELTDRFCESIMTTVLNNAKACLDNRTNYDARAEIMFAGMHAHNGMASTGREEDWASHKMEYDITTISGASHGAGLAIIYPAWMKYVYKHDLSRFALFANKVFGIEIDSSNLEKTALKGIEALESFYKMLDMPIRLSAVGINCSMIDDMANNVTSNGMNEIGSFVRLNKDDVLNIYKLAL